MNSDVLYTSTGEISTALDGISEMVVGHAYHFGWNVHYKQLMEKEEIEPGFYRVRWMASGREQRQIRHEAEHHTPRGCEPGGDEPANQRFREQYATWLAQQRMVPDDVHNPIFDDHYTGKE